MTGLEGGVLVTGKIGAKHPEVCERISAKVSCQKEGQVSRDLMTFRKALLDQKVFVGNPKGPMCVVTTREGLTCVAVLLVSWVQFDIRLMARDASK